MAVSASENPASPTLLVSRHPGAVAWLQAEARRRGWQGAETVAHLEVVPAGIRRVAGTLPLTRISDLLAAGIEVWHLHLPQPNQEERGREHSRANMVARGARLLRVRCLELTEDP